MVLLLGHRDVRCTRRALSEYLGCELHPSVERSRPPAEAAARCETERVRRLGDDVTEPGLLFDGGEHCRGQPGGHGRGGGVSNMLIQLACALRCRGGRLASPGAVAGDVAGVSVRWAPVPAALRALPVALPPENGDG